jgi:hypothetical protein
MKKYIDDNGNVIEDKWTAQLRQDEKWELVYSGNSHKKTGYTTKDFDTMTLFVAYMNTGIRSDMPDTIIEDLDYIKKTYCNE